MTLNLDHLLETYRAAKAHENEIMSRRPAGAPRAGWRMEQNTGPQASWRVYRGSKRCWARLNYEVKPVLEIWEDREEGRRIENIDLRAEDAAERLRAYTLPAPGDMTNIEFATIRQDLGLTQAQLAPLLELGSSLRVSEYERKTNPRKIPAHIARLMRAMADGWRPADWPLAP